MTAWMVETLIATSLLMLAVLMIRDVVAKHFGPRIAYLLWLAPAMRMLMPPLPPEWWGGAIAPVQSVVVVLEGASSLSFQPTIAGEGGSAFWMMLIIIWSGGAALFFGWHVARYIAFSRSVMANAQPLFNRDNVRIAVSSAVTSPIAFGIFGKAVVLPADFEHRFNAVEQRLAIAHEVTHHARRDLWVNLGALAMLALHWFNPLAHIAHRAFRLDQEAACDAIVLTGASADERSAYGSALFKSATGGVPLAVCAMGTATQIKVRLRRIIEGKGRRGGSLFALFVIGGGLVATASGGAVAETIPSVIAAPQKGEFAATMPLATVVETTLRSKTKPRQRSQKHVVVVQTSVPQPPVSQASVPQPPSPQGDIATPIPPAPPAPARIASASCTQGSARQIITTTERTNGGAPRNVTVVICHQNSHVQTRGILDALSAARSSIADEDALSEADRLAVLSSLDAQIAIFTRAPMTF